MARIPLELVDDKKSLDKISSKFKKLNSEAAKVKLGFTNKANLNNAIKGMERMSKELGRVKKGADQANSSFKNISSSLFGQVTAANIASRAILSLGSGIRETFNDVREFDRGIREINSLLPQNAKLTEDTVDSIEKLGNAYGKDPQEQARAFYQIVSAGVKDTSTQLRLLETANEAAIAGLTDTATAVNVLTSIFNVYRDTGIDVLEISDALFAAVREGKTTFDELSGSIGRVAPIAKSAGLGIKQVTGALAFLTKGGLSTDEATTGLRATIAQILKPAEEATRIAKQLGLEFDVTALKTKGLAGFFGELARATNGNTATIAKLFPNIRALGPVLNIVNGDFEDFQRVLNETEDSFGATSDASRELKGSLDFELDRLSQTFANAGRSIGSFFSPAIKEAASVINTVFGEVTRAEQIDFLKDKLIELESAVANLDLTPIRRFGVNDIQSANRAIEETRNRILNLEKASKSSSRSVKTVREEIVAIEEEISSLQKSGLGEAFDAQRIQSAQERYSELVKELQALETIEAKKPVEELNQELSKLTSQELKALESELKRIDTSTVEGIEAQARARVKVIRDALSQNLIDAKKAKDLEVQVFKDAEERKTKIEKAEAKKRAQFTAQLASSVISSGSQGNARGLLQAGVTAGVTGLTGSQEAGQVAGELASALSQDSDVFQKQIQNTIDQLPILVENIVNNIPFLVEKSFTALDEVFLRLIDRAPEITDRFTREFIQRTPAIINSFIKQQPKIAAEFIKQQPKIAKSFIEALINEAPRFIDSLIKEVTSVSGGGIGGAIGGGAIGGPIGSVIGALGFSSGGTVPGGAPYTDRIPAVLTPGEEVLSREDVSNRDSTNAALLGGIASIQELLLRPLTVEGQIVGMDDRAFATQLIRIQRSGIRTA